MRGRGFTLVELLVALSLMFVALLGMISLQVTAQRAAQQSRALTEAVALAQDRLERVRRLPLAQITELKEKGLDVQGAAKGGAYTRTTTLGLLAGNTVVRVDVAWNDFAGKAHAVTLRTVRAP